MDDPNQTAVENAQDFADDGIDRTSDSPIVQVVDGEVIYRASAVGGCPRKLWAARSGYPAHGPGEKMQAIFDRGKELEPIILNALIEKGWELRNYQGEVFFQVVTLPSGLCISIMGHYDCEARYPMPPSTPNITTAWSEWYPCDVKGFGKDLVSEYLSHGIDNLPHYQWQQSIYVIGHPLAKAFLMPIWNKDTSELVSSSLYPRIPDITLSDIERKLLEVELAYQNSQMPECTNEFPCPYFQLHDTKEQSELPDIAKLLITARQNADAKIKLFTEAKNTMTEEILKVLGDQVGVFSCSWENHTITVQANSDKFNTAHAKSLLKEAGFNIESDEFKIPGKGVKLVITTT